jgi:glycogen debranching enzyme
MNVHDEVVRRMTWAGPDADGPETLLNREWLVTNGLGGSASGTVAGVVTRRQHGLLVAALPAPHGRTVMLSHLYERLRLPDGALMAFGGDEREGDALEVPAMNHLVELRLEQGLPIWRYDVKGYVLEKQLLLPHLQNTVHVTYQLLSGPGPVRLELRPSMNFRPQEDPVDRPIAATYVFTGIGNRYEIAGPPSLPPLRLFTHGQGGALTLDGGVMRHVRYRVEASRGYESQGELWSPGYFSVDLIPAQLVDPTEERVAHLPRRDQERPGDAPVSGRIGDDDGIMDVDEAKTPRVPDLVSRPGAASDLGSRRPPLWDPGPLAVLPELDYQMTLVASTESWETIMALSPDEAERAEHQRRGRLLRVAAPVTQTDFASELVLAADQFIISPAGRSEDLARAHAAGDEVNTIIAGYHWFTDWGRDTMISLEGLTLTTGRADEAGYILRMFARHVRDGLIPNMFPEGERDGLYHTADATLWFFHALDRYLAATDDRPTLTLLIPILRDIVEHHLRGTRFGIGLDPADGLLSQGAEGYQLTWMDAKVEDWVVTPRRGKAVEINALWYNALCLLAGWLADEHGEDAGGGLRAHAERARASFNLRFWNAADSCLYDIVDGPAGDDTACRPNQLFAISLTHPVLDRARWEPVLDVVRERLLTPVGLRSLAPGHPDYRSHYFGDLRSRDAAYHQGTVWAWLSGPFVDAWLKAYPDDRAGARQVLSGFEAHLGESCLGSIGEIFDAEPPYTPRGCVAQAWSVAEVLRALARTA